MSNQLITTEIVPRLMADRLFLKEKIRDYWFEIGLRDENTDAEIINKLRENLEFTNDKIIQIEQTLMRLNNLLKEEN